MSSLKNFSLRVLVIILALSFIFPGHIIASGETEVSVPSVNQEAQKPFGFSLLMLAENAELFLTERIEKTTKTSREVRETYTVLKDQAVLGDLAFNAYILPNGDLYYYLKYSSGSGSREGIWVRLPYVVERFDLRTVQYPQGFDNTKSVMSVFGNQTPENNVLIEALAPTTVYIDSENLNCLMSYTGVFQNGEHLTRKELYNEARNIGLTREGIRIYLPAVENGFSEQWGILSHERLVRWEDPTTVAALRVADLNRIKKWGGDGQYYQLPVGYTPYYTNGFYRNSANHIGDQFIRNQGRIFDDLGYVTMDTLIKTQNAHGFWSTSTRADWLYQDYGIGAGYFDTRWDTEAALSLLRGYRKYQEPRALEAAKEYADFYCSFALANSYKTKNGGILVYDYGFNALPGIKTHVSLNHLLCEMNFLLEMYSTTREKGYLEVVDKILKGIRDTASSWIKSNSDLHYAYLPGGKYGRIDYPTLTFNDLRYSQSLIKSVYGSEDASIKMLLESKLKYLEKNNIPH